MLIDEWLKLDSASRTKRSRDLIKSLGIEKEQETLLLKSYRENRNYGNHPKHLLPDIFLALSQIRESENADLALLDLYYTTSEDDETSCEKIFNLLRGLTQESFQVEDSYRRARLHWIHLLILRYEDEDNEAMENYITEVYSRGDLNPYVWDRIFGAIKGWEELWRLYPWIISLENKFEDLPERYHETVRAILNTYRESLSYVQGIRSRIPECLDATSSGEMGIPAFRKILKEMAEGGERFPFTPGQIQKVSRNSDLHPALILYAAFIYKESEVGGKAQKVVSFLKRNPGLYSESALLPYFEIALWLWDKSGKWHSLDPQILWEESLKITENQFSQNAPALWWYKLGDFFENLWVYLLERGIQVSETPKVFGQLLKHPSRFIQLASSSAILEIVRKKGRIQPIISEVRAYLREDHQLKNPFATGQDIPEEKREEPDFHPDPASLYKPTNAPEGEGFFNLDNLLGLLEECQPPEVVYRLMEALKLSLDNNKNSPETREIRRELEEYQKENAIEEEEEEEEEETTL